MSRSMKKYPYVKDVKSSKWGKKYCSRKIRRIKDIPNGNAYKKMNERWNYIRDYYFSMTWKEYKQQYGEYAIYYKWHRMYIDK